jgi:hypothetical protein
MLVVFQLIPPTVLKLSRDWNECETLLDGCHSGQLPHLYRRSGGDPLAGQVHEPALGRALTSFPFSAPLPTVLSCDHSRCTWRMIHVFPPVTFIEPELKRALLTMC